eukprot:TRINITY_DN93712_c0_g1_i1.p1 TRINITY_DN93712_c0_g1~~TRINITY_DN93712_c0_g1_i1.p1  ORF type:complete len:466 (-),score=47.64 TRINITY_DN93712_c0_g1_i1:111-1457(-)
MNNKQICYLINIKMQTIPRNALFHSQPCIGLNPNYKEKLTIYTHDQQKFIVEANFSITALEICYELTGRLNSPSMFSLYLSMRGTSVPILDQVLRTVDKDDCPLRIHVMLRLMRVPHDFFALYNASPMHILQPITEEGSLSEIMVKERLKSQPYFIMKDTLYFRTKGKASAIPLTKAKVLLEEGTLTLQIPNAEQLKFQISKKEELLKVHKILVFAVEHAKLNGELKDLQEKTAKLEPKIALYDEMEVLEKSYGTEGMLKFAGSRRQLFHELEQHSPVAKCIGKLYEMIENVENAVKIEDKYEWLLNTYKWIESLKAKRKGDGKETGDVFEKVKEEYLQEDIREIMREIVPSKLFEKIRTTIETYEVFLAGRADQICNEIKQNTTNKIRQISHGREILSDTTLSSLKGLVAYRRESPLEKVLTNEPQKVYSYKILYFNFFMQKKSVKA